MPKSDWKHDETNEYKRDVLIRKLEKERMRASLFECLLDVQRRVCCCEVLMIIFSHQDFLSVERKEVGGADENINSGEMKKNVSLK